MHLTAAQGWLELGNHEEAFEELEQIDAPLRGHPDVLEVRWGIYASIEKWDYCLEIGSAMVRLDPARFTGWINRSFALHCLKRTKEAYEQLKEALRRHDEEELIWYNLACYACVLGKEFEARKRLAKAIDLGGDGVIFLAMLSFLSLPFDAVSLSSVMPKRESPSYEVRPCVCPGIRLPHRLVRLSH